MARSQTVLKSGLHRYDNCRDFINDFEIGGNDLILADRSIFNPYFGELPISAEILFQATGGNGGSLQTVSLKIASGLTAGCSRIIGIGDGVVMDMAKVLSLRNGLPAARFGRKNGGLAKDRELILVPAVCGISSEVTTPSLLELGDSNPDLATAIRSVHADSIAMIPQLIEGLSYPQFIGGAVDTLVHAVEALASPAGSSITRLFAFKAVEILVAALQAIAANGPMVRIGLLADFLEAANYANIAFENAGAGPVHAISAPLRERYHVPHGEANRIFFAPFFEMYMSKKSAAQTLSDLNEMLGSMMGCATDEAYAALEDLLEHVLPRRRLREFGVVRSELQNFTCHIVSKQRRCLGNSYVTFDADDIYAISHRVF